MIKVCETYGAEHNLVFSTDPDPKKSKTKCMYFTRKCQTSVVYPTPVKLDGKNLPWVQRADHLGHVLHQDGSMAADGVRARASFMSRSSDIRDSLYFADPRQRVKAIDLYCCDGYGSMLLGTSEVNMLRAISRHGTSKLDMHGGYHQKLTLIW